MYNYIFLVGRLVRDVEVHKTSSEKSVSTITLAVNKPFKNTNGNYDVDFVPITLWDQICDITNEYCKKGDMVAIKGRVQMKKEVLANNVNSNQIEIIAERVIFISSNKNALD